MIGLRKITTGGFAVAMIELAFAAASPHALAFGIVPTDGRSWATILTQENEGYPNPAGDSRCALASRPVVDAHGHFMGYHTFNVCK